ncbi:MAG: hypothetical protein EOO05_12185 [Chitinophagaceae bacterium]|nr:MAG: hypothetical protein EOO05_12185 [Chitinophagaceae bacterium]
MEKGYTVPGIPSFICKVRILFVNSGMRKLIAAAGLLLAVLRVSSQEIMDVDSLLKLLPSAKQDTNTVVLYIKIGQQYENNNPQLAAAYYRSSWALSKKLNYLAGEIKYATNYTYLLNMRGMYDSSLTLNLYSLQLARQLNDSLYIGKTLFNTGTSYQQMGEYEEATKCYEEGKVIFEKFGNATIVAQSYDVLQVLAYNLKDYAKGVALGEKAVSLIRRNRAASSWLGPTLINLGTNYTQARMPEKAFAVYKEALAISKSEENEFMELAVLMDLADLEIQSGQYAPAKPYLEKGLVLARKLESYENELICLRGIAYTYLHSGDYAKSDQYIADALAISFRYNLRAERGDLYTHLSNLAYAKQDMKMGAYYARESSALGDSLLNESVRKTTLMLEKKYETEKDKSQILKLESDKKEQQFTIDRKNVLNAALIAGAVVLVLLIALLYRNYRQKQALQQQRITELEAEKQLAATEAVLKGEELERTRLARDLHDGLGGMLSGIKYSLNTMKGNMIMTPENAQAFERSVDMLDSSIKEMRRVAHNMMPEALVKFGLDEALKDFCNDINQSGALTVNYQSIGLKDAVLEQTMAITIYRIVQELINNTMKHAGAANAIVQVTKTNDQLAVTVEDDGKGFDTSILRAAKGIGWSNIQNRVEFLKGRMDVSSQEGKGTSVLIEIGV